VLILSARNPEVGGLGLRRLQLHLGLRHGLVRIDAGLEQGLRQLERFLIGHYGRIE
jgi:hypothetical protein